MTDNNGWANDDPEAPFNKPTEIRVTSPSGGSKGRKLARYDLIPVLPLRKLAEQYGRGATKYGDRNYEKGYDWSLSYAACQRHLNAFWGGEDWDPEFPDAHHLDAAMFHVMAMREFFENHRGYDDRPTTVKTSGLERTTTETFQRIARNKPPTREFARSQQTTPRNGVQNIEEKWQDNQIEI